MNQNIQNLANREEALRIKAESLESDMASRESILLSEREKLTLDKAKFNAVQDSFQSKVNAIMGVK